MSVVTSCYELPPSLAPSGVWLWNLPNLKLIRLVAIVYNLDTSLGRARSRKKWEGVPPLRTACRHHYHWQLVIQGLPHGPIPKTGGKSAEPPKNLQLELGRLPKSWS